jgi:AcrR family transcriptional regulator
MLIRSCYKSEVPKQVDHEARRRALAEAACAVVARDGVDGASLRSVAIEAGWSVGSMRHYFATKADLLVFALGYVGERIEERIEARGSDDGSALGALRSAVTEMLPLDATRLREALVWLAFIARAGGEPSLTEAAHQVWRGINGPLTRRFQDAVDRGELPPDFPVRRRALALQAVVDGLVVHLATTPDLVSVEDALAVLDHQLGLSQLPAH